MKENESIKIIGGIVVVAGGIYLGKRYLDHLKDVEIQKAQQQANLLKAVTSGNAIAPTVNEVKAEIEKNKNAQTFTKSEYLNFANKIYSNINSQNMVGIVDTFAKLKTNTDLKLLSIYFGVKVFKSDAIYEEYKLQPLNLSQAITMLTPQLFQMKLKALLNAKKITYNLF